MKKTKTYTFPDSFILPRCAIIAALTLLVDKSHLSNEVKKHCKMGLKVIEIIDANQDYNTRTNLLSKKEFEVFFALFPAVHFKNRELISTIIIINHIGLCIKTNTIENVT